MAEPTTTRAALRRTVCLQMGMRFQRYKQYATITEHTGNLVRDRAFLRQADDYWNRSWFYAVSLQESRMVVKSLQSDASVEMEFALSATMLAGDQYELLDFYSAQSVHEAINAAIRDGWPAFFATVEDVQFCVARDRMDIDISGLSAWMVTQVWIERPHSIERYDVSAGTTTQCTLNTTNDLSRVDSNWWLTFHDGTGRGYARQIATFSNVTKIATWTTALPVAVDATTKVSLANPLDKVVDWYPAHACSFDRNMWPGKLRFKAPYDNYFLGSRVRIVYLSQPAELVDDTSSTPVPREFVIARARAFLYDWHKDDTRQDQGRYDRNFADQMAKSEQLKKEKAFQPPDQLMWTESDPALQHGMYSDPTGDPLGWRDF